MGPTARLPAGGGPIQGAGHPLPPSLLHYTWSSFRYGSRSCVVARTSGQVNSPSSAHDTPALYAGCPHFVPNPNRIAVAVARWWRVGPVVHAAPHIPEVMAQDTGTRRVNAAYAIRIGFDVSLSFQLLLRLFSRKQLFTCTSPPGQTSQSRRHTS